MRRCIKTGYVKKTIHDSGTEHSQGKREITKERRGTAQV